MAIQQTTGTIAAATQTVSLGNMGDNAATVLVYGTHSGITLVFEGTLDGTNWFPTQAYSLKSGLIIPASTLALATNVSRGFMVPFGVWTKIRVRGSVYSSGTLNVIMQSGPGDLALVGGANIDFSLNNVGLSNVQLAAGNNGAVTLVNSGPGILHNLMVTTAGSVSLVIYDNASAASGTILYASPATYTLGTQTQLNLMFLNGVTANQATGTAAVNASYTLL